MGGHEPEVAGIAEDLGRVADAVVQSGDGADEQSVGHDQHGAVLGDEVKCGGRGEGGAFGKRAEAFAAGQGAIGVMRLFTIQGVVGV